MRMHMRVPGLVAPCGILEQSAYDVSRTLRHFQPLSDTPEAMLRTRRGARGMAARVAAAPIKGSRSTPTLPGPPTQSVPAAAPACGRRSTRQSSGMLAREASTTVVASMTLEQAHGGGRDLCQAGDAGAVVCPRPTWGGHSPSHNQ